MRTNKHDFSKELLFDLYEEHKSLSAVAKHLGCAPATVRNAMRKFDLAYEKAYRKYPVNHHFFDVEHESEAQFYWAGFLAANGHVTKTSSKSTAYRIEVNVALRDKWYLQKMLADFESGAKVFERQHHSRSNDNFFAKTVISSKYMVYDLERFNITSNKEFTYHMPLWLVRHHLIRHFLRGWVDGKGSFSNRELRTSGPVEFIEQMKNILSNLNLVDPNRPTAPTGPNLVSVIYTNFSDLNKIINFLYGGATQFHDRKRESALAIITEINDQTTQNRN